MRDDVMDMVIISLEGFGASMLEGRLPLRESLIISILFENVDFPNIKASLIAWVSAVNMLTLGSGCIIILLINVRSILQCYNL